MCPRVFTDRVVDDLNPVLNFTRKEVESLLHFVEEEPDKISLETREELETVIYQACHLYPHLITKVQLLMCVTLTLQERQFCRLVFKYRFLLTYP